MPAYKDEQRGTWYCQFYYEDWQGNKKKKQKRGFKTKKEALEWENNFKLSANANMDMTLGAFVEIYLGDFSANFFFNLTSSNEDKDKFMYKYLDTPDSVESGVILYRNAFSISSYEGKKDWLGLGKRSRKSPAAASHPTGAWRVRENQMAGFVLIDKRENSVLQDMANRQGLDENIYYQLFVEIILIGIKEFERYRQSIIRKINVKNQQEEQKATPVSDRVISKPSSVSEFTKDEAKQLAAELKGYKKEGKQYQKDKEAVEARYKYDVRILNVLATTGLKASSIAHEMKNDRNAIFESYNNIVDALKEWIGYVDCE